VVSGTDALAFLEETLAYLGFSRREANEFIIYWLPQLEQHPYNYLRFLQDEWESMVPLTVNPVPDSVLRVLMLHVPVDETFSCPPQTLVPVERHGFTLVEWGGRTLAGQAIH
ncbi:hypothetical protein KJ865_13360, partial [Myxococcota bacterium]|nr:hypothetical protein [Myxococcota bacterium]